MIGFLAVAALAASTSQTEITVYNAGFGLVKESRKLAVKKGRQSLAIQDVPSLINPTSVAIKPLAGKAPFSLLEQNYEYDLISTQAILNKSVGQQVRFVRTIGQKKEVLTGTLLSAPTAIVSSGGASQPTYNGMVIRTDDNRIVLDPTGEIEVRAIPPGLISRPTLTWDVDSPGTGMEDVELSYITNGLGWDANYVLTLNSKGGADLQGWVTLNNTSGATWKDARLKLLAGNVNVVQAKAPVELGVVTKSDAVAAAPAFAEQALFEYHLYTLQRPTTLRNNETKQISLLEGHGVSVTKKLIIDSIDGQYYPGEGEVGTGDIKPDVRLEFVNSATNGLGMPLPKGSFRVYQRDKSGSVQMLGEDSIDHTPRNEKIALNVGTSFDVVATRKRLAYKVINHRRYREEFSIEVRNRKTEPETVYVFERHYGDWRITAETQPYTKLDSNTAQFVVTLKPNESKTVTYSVDTRW